MSIDDSTSANTNSTKPETPQTTKEESISSTPSKSSSQKAEDTKFDDKKVEESKKPEDPKMTKE